MDFDYGNKKADGQYERHPTEVSPERKFIRPVRRSYLHVGIAGPTNPLRDLNEDEKRQYESYGYVKFEEYPENESSIVGRFWTQAKLDSVGKGCGGVTSMPLNIAETYATNPSFYDRTFCCGCGQYLPVGADGEFVWNEGNLGQERVGT